MVHPLKTQSAARTALKPFLNLSLNFNLISCPCLHAVVRRFGTQACPLTPSCPPPYQGGGGGWGFRAHSRTPDHSSPKNRDPIHHVYLGTIGKVLFETFGDEVFPMIGNAEGFDQILFELLIEKIGGIRRIR